MAYVAKPEDELGFAIVVGGLATLMAFWTWRTRSRAATVVSLVLGVLWTLLFGGYAIANATTNEDVEALVRVGDLVAVVAGLMILGGAVDRLRGSRPAGAAVDR